jgi:hypothetical protein
MNNNEDLSRYQDDFLRAAFLGEQPSATMAALVQQPGFAVYRNTLLKACVDNLAANFPTVMRLVDEAWFRATAREYASAEPPSNVSLFDYGATFPDFLASFPPAADLSYLADVAWLDKLWIDCHTAADAQPLTAAELAALPPHLLGETSLAPHPATRWMACRDHPAGRIWISNREQQEFDSSLPWLGDSVLLTRIGDAVHWRPIEPGVAAFLDACAHGAPLQDAAEQALSVQPDLDIAATLALLLQANSFITLRETS